MAIEAGTLAAWAFGIAAVAQFIVNRRDMNARNAQDRADAKAREDRARDDDLDRRWLAEKRLIYAKVLGALTAQSRALARLSASRTLIGRADPAEPERLAQVQAEWAEIEETLGEFDLLAPDGVREVVGRAVDAVSTFEWAFRKRLGPIDDADDEERDQAFDRADAALSAALVALRADLGAGGPATAASRR